MTADKKTIAAGAGSVVAWGQLSEILNAEPGARLVADSFGQLVGEMMREVTADVFDAFLQQASQAVDLQLSAMGERGIIRGGAVTGTGVFKSATVWRDSRPVPRHKRLHFVVVHFTNGEPEVHKCTGVAWRIAKRAIARHVRRQRDVVRIAFVMQPVPPAERVTFKTTVGEVAP